MEPSQPHVPFKRRPLSPFVRSLVLSNDRDYLFFRRQTVVPSCTFYHLVPRSLFFRQVRRSFVKEFVK